MKLYKYTLLKQDGTIKDLGVSKQKPFSELYTILNCGTIEIINFEYWKDRGYGRCEMYGDEEGRFNSKNHRNPHFNVIKDLDGSEWDVVGDIVKEEVYKA
jgi:hypothetical protein